MRKITLAARCIHKLQAIFSVYLLNPHNGDLVLSVVSILDSPNHDILGVKFDSKLTFKDHLRRIVSCVTQRIDILTLE